jgi:hypothetical protein
VQKQKASLRSTLPASKKEKKEGKEKEKKTLCSKWEARVP